jgi:hypothetical protein
VPELAIQNCFEVQISVGIKIYLTKYLKGKVSAVNYHVFKRLIRGGIISLFPRVCNNSVITGNYFTASGHNHLCCDESKTRSCEDEDAPCVMCDTEVYIFFAQ